MTVHRSAETWVNLTIRPWPIDGSPGNVLTYRFAMQAWADAGSYRGLAEGRIPVGGYGDITRAMSSLDGQYEVDTWSVTILDTDGLMRGLLADATTNLIDQGRWEVHVEMTSHEGRLAEVEPRTMIRGIVTDATPDAGRLFTLQVKDILGGHLAGFDLDAQIPLWKLKDDFGDLAELPDAMSEQVAPLVYGEDSDHGTVDGSGVNAEKGLVPVYYVGKSLISAGLPGTPPTSPTYAHPPSNLTVTPVGSGATHTVRCGVTAVTTFGETTLSNIVTVSNYPELDFGDRTIPHNTAPRRADWSWMAPDNVDGGEVIGYRMYVIDDTTTGTPRYRLDMNFNPAGNASTVYSDDGDDSHFKAMYPGPPGINKAQVAPGTPGSPGSGPMFFDTFVVAAGALPWDHVDVYGSDLAASGTAKRVRLDGSTPNSGIRNVQIIAPGDALWPNADNWLEVNGRRYTVFYTRGPVGQAHIDGQVAMALNICGYTEQPDGTGLLIDQAGFVAQHLLENWSGLDPDQLTYTNGATWNDDPPFANGDPKLKTSGFAQFQTDGIARMATTLGPVFRFVINKPITLRDWMGWFFWSTGGGLWATNHHGQLFPFYLPHTTVSPSEGTIYRDRIEIKQWLTPIIDRQTITELTYIFDFDSELQDWRQPEKTITDQDLEDANGGRPKTRERVEMRLVGDPFTAATSGAYLLELLKRPRIFKAFETSFRGLEDDLSDPVTLTHYDGIGTNGETDTLGIVARHVIALNRDTVVLTALDVSQLGIPVIPGTTELPEMSDGFLWPTFGEGRLLGAAA